jgi:hypothetical protein
MNNAAQCSPVRASWKAVNLAGLAGLCGCSSSPSAAPAQSPSSRFVIAAAASAPRPPFEFAPEDAALLDEVQRGCFNFMWNAANAKTGMVPDRTSVTTVSTAGVGFQLSGIVIGVERGWITRNQGCERVMLILTSLNRDPAIRHEGLFQHFIDGDTAGPHTNGDLEHVVSTIDSGLLMSGLIVVSQYFGGDVKALADEMVASANWRAFVSGEEAKPHEQGFISLGWKPDDKAKSTGPGKYLPYYWVDSGDEHKLVTFLAVCAPIEAHRVDSALYYRLRRQVGEYAGVQPFVWFPWSGALFTHFFAHCFMDYASMGMDDPSALGVGRRPRVDWWENSRRAAQFHRIKAMEHSDTHPTFGESSWGFTAADCLKGYQVPGVFPKLVTFEGDREKWDFESFVPKDDLGDGSIAPYGAASMIMFEPKAALGAMRHYRSLVDEAGEALAWRDPATGGFGFVDAFRLKTDSTPSWAAGDVLAIDQGPMLLAIENARSGLIWRLFHEHPFVKAGMERLKLRATSR